MQYLKRSKNLTAKFITLAVITLSTASCMDKFPGFLRETQHQGERVYWQGMARDGDIEAQYDAGRLNCCGIRPLRDEVEALNYYCKAALDGHPASLIEVGKLYSHQNAEMRDATIIPKDDAISYTMYSMAADKGSQEAASRKMALLKTISTSDLELANSYRAKFPNMPCSLTR